MIGPDGEWHEREPQDDDEPRPPMGRRCPECRCMGGHVPGCPETPEPYEPEPEEAP